jgi:hypothetical protein
VTELTFIVETIYPVDTGTLMVSTQQEEVLGIFDLVRQQEADGFQRLLASVHVVSQEQVVGLGGKSSVLKQSQQVCVLTVDVT